MILNQKELLIQTALGLIGIGLPEEYIIRICKLQELAKEKGGLGNITIEDSVDIISKVGSEVALRLDSKK